MEGGQATLATRRQLVARLNDPVVAAFGAVADVQRVQRWLKKRYKPHQTA